MLQDSHHDSNQITGSQGGLSRRGFMLSATAVTAAAASASCAQPAGSSSAKATTTDSSSSENAFLADRLLMGNIKLALPPRDKRI